MGMIAMLKDVLLMGDAWNGGWWMRCVILRDGGRADGEVVRGISGGGGRTSGVVVGGGVEGKVWNGGSWGMMREECEAVQKYRNGLSRFQSPRDVSEVTFANRSNRTLAAPVV